MHEETKSYSNQTPSQANSQDVVMSETGAAHDHDLILSSKFPSPDSFATVFSYVGSMQELSELIPLLNKKGAAFFKAK